MNFQQPFFQGNQWNNSGFDDQSAFAKDTDSQRVKINRGSSQGMLSGMKSPPFKNLRPMHSDRKPLFSNENSAFVAAEQMTNSSALDKAPKNAFSKHKYHNSNVPSSHRTNVMMHHEAGFELPINEDFGTNVESIKASPQDQTSAKEGSNSLFIQSGRSRNKTQNSRSIQLQQVSRKGQSQKKPMLNGDP